ncbi:MAG: AmmeMemoRadiSam system protein B [Candidatus Aminicenantes bacterium]|nr:AmmeMemoRadiSam system protein B [Candidatus Aminicenantes bacterium]
MAKKKRTVFIFIVISIHFFFFLSCAEEKTRSYLTTGNWYPSSKSDLHAMLNHYFENAKSKKIPGKIAALIGPHAGINYSGQCAANAYKQLIKHSDTIKRVFLFGVSHQGRFAGCCVSGFSYNATPLGKIPVDQEITAALAKEKFFKVDNRIMQYEHSIENHLPFLQKALKKREYKIIPILFGYLQDKDFQPIADILKKYIDAHALVIASTDLTHFGANFGYRPFMDDIKNNLTKLDMGIIDPVLRLDFDSYREYEKKTGITMCGFNPVGVLIKLFSGKTHRGILIDYYKSGDKGSDYSISVSYASIIITRNSNGNSSSQVKKKSTKKPVPPELSEKEKKILLSIARKSLQAYVREQIPPKDIETKYAISEKLKEKTGVFVTLKINGHLRGCIGSIIGSAPLYLGVRDNAIKAGLSDPRFPPVKAAELRQIDMEVSVMTPLQKIADYSKIRLGTDGVIIKKGSRQAVFLPQVALETGWDLDEFLSQLCRKAWLPVDAYKKPGMEFYIFQAQVFGEKEHK